MLQVRVLSLRPKREKGEQKLLLFPFAESGGENLLRACGTAIDLDTASIKLDTIGSSAQALRVFDRFRVLSLRPNKHRNYDTKRYRKSGAFFYSKALIYKAFLLSRW